jgi:hypothetical protein
MIYSLALTKEQFSRLKSLIFKKSSIIPEIELRFGTITNTSFVSTNSPEFFQNFLDKLKYNKDLVSFDIIKDIVYSKQKHRKIVSSNNVITYESKDKTNDDITVIKNFKNNELSTIRFSYALEKPSSKEEFDKEQKNIMERQRNRTSFKFKNFMFDLSIVTEKSARGVQTKYEIEAELTKEYVDQMLKAGTVTGFRMFTDVVKSICSVYYENIHTVFSVEVYQGIKDIISGIYENLDKALRPKNIYIEDAKTGLLNHAVTNKLDGVGYNLFCITTTIDNEKILSFYLRNRIDLWRIGIIPYKNLSQSIIDSIPTFEKMILDTEVYNNGIYVFDMIYSPSNSQSNPLFERLSIAQQYIDMINSLNDPFIKTFTYQVKKFFMTSEIDKDVKNTLNEMSKTYGTDILKHNDGIIFQPSGPYNPKNQIYKWKFFSKITIDFLFKTKNISNTTTTYLCLVVGKSSNLTPFRDPVNRIPLEITVKNEEIFNGIKGANLNNFVMEVGMDKEELKIHRIRFDKNPEDTNYIHTAIKTWEDMVNELTLPSVVRALVNGRAEKNIIDKKEIIEEVEEPYEIVFDDNFTVRDYFPGVIPNPFRFSNVSVYSSANEDQAEKTLDVIKLFLDSNKLKNMSIIDLSSCIGGNTWIFNDSFKDVYANELNPLHFKLLKHNMLSMHKFNITFLNQNAADLIKNMNVDVVFADPPWGGINYKEKPEVGYYKDGVFYEISNLLSMYPDFAKELIVLRVPHDYKINKISNFKNKYTFVFSDHQNIPIYDIVVFSNNTIDKPLKSVINVFRVNYKTFKFNKISQIKEKELDRDLKMLEEYQSRLKPTVEGNIITKVESKVLTFFPPGPSNIWSVKDITNILHLNDAILLSNFIFHNSLAYGKKQEYFNLSEESTMLDLSPLIGNTDIVLGKVFRNLTVITTNEDEQKVLINNFLEFMALNIEVIKDVSFTKYNADIIYVDLLVKKVLPSVIKQLKNNCKLLVLRVKSELSNDEINNLFEPTFYLESEIIYNKFKFISIFTTAPEQASVKNYSVVKITVSCMEIFRSQYNIAKRSLIETYSANKSVLDIGFGKGGDIFKYIGVKTTKVLGVEPNKEFISDFRKRITDKTRSWIDNNVKILNTEGQKSDDIIKFVNKETKNKKVDVVNMFFSMSFFFKDKENLSALAKTIGESLAEDGHFVGAFMDGTDIQDVLVNEKKIITPCYEIINENVTLDKVFDQRITFNIKESNTATTQIEYLVYLEELEKELVKYNVYLKEIISSPDMIDYSLLTNDDKYLANFYKFFVFKKGYEKIVNISTFYPLQINNEYLMRLPIQPDGNSFFTSILKALDQNLVTLEYVENLRLHLADNYTLEYYESDGISCISNLNLYLSNLVKLPYFETCVYNVFGESSQTFYNMFKDFVKDMNEINSINKYINVLVKKFEQKGYDKENVKEFFRGVHIRVYMDYVEWISTNNVWHSSWMYKFVEEQLNINIYIISNKSKKISNVKKIEDNGKVNIILLDNSDMHIEPLAKVVDNRYVTTFTNDEVKSFL